MRKYILFIIFVFIHITITGCTTSTDESKVNVRIHNDSSEDLNNITLNLVSSETFDSFFENSDTLTYEVSNVASKAYSEYYPADEETRDIELIFDVNGDEEINRMQVSDFDTLLSGDYTISFQDNYLFELESMTHDGTSEDGSVKVRIMNNTSFDFESVFLTLDQERPEDPDSPESRNNVERKEVDFGNLASGAATNYVETDIGFNVPRGYTFNVNGQEENYWNFDFESYFYEDYETLDPGLYTYVISYTGIQVYFSDFTKD
ncbi:hypothetical protein [Gracilimonas mengyeensis]|uniref:Uncharacterized protein n=1 Tax=Gracilimonas mengyeensis TaxID=1302730 RepID=A0A521AC78_9BACT|nr:hypothetical protein [Gracilimonas mengyeensis]SMO32392.1 hypothetical protein SAMN06265219_10144 [Gracilimonas mengyeensis]